ncbi:MAG: hypothetical protein KF857_03445 [Fimbriimonadaceae bacterium]|nr:hypothetical protein [Fimbriimonadaceae bacterium]
MADFLNLTETELISFAQNFAVKLAVHEPVLTTVAAADVTQANTNSTTLAAAVNTVNNIREDAQEYTNVKNIMLYAPLGTAVPTAPSATAWADFPVGAIAGIVPWYRQIAARIKTDPGYTVAIGQDLGIVSTGAAPGVTPPVLTGTALTGYNVEVGWNRGGHAGVRVRSQRAAEATWTEIGTDMTPPFVDNRAALVAGEPEERRYQAAYVDADVVTTDWSATLTVIAHS